MSSSSSRQRSSSSHTANGMKRKQTEEDSPREKRQKEDKDSLDAYKDFAQWIIRTEHLFISWITVLDVGMELDAREIANIDEFMKKYRIEVSVVRRMRRQHSQFKSDMEKIKCKQRFEKALISALNQASRGARSDDSNTLLSKGLDYVAEMHGMLIPQILPNKPKGETHGFHHPMIARLLCPIDQIASFDKDPEGFSANVLNGAIKINSRDYPLCLYDEEEIDIEDPGVGLLRSKLLVAFYKHIFTSPSSALLTKPGRTKSKKGQAEKHDMREVTPGSIAYAATQLRWCLSASDDWRLGDGTWIAEDFYSAIMLAFGITVPYDEKKLNDDNGDDDWVTNTLAWWNTQIFSTSSAAATSSPARESTLDKLLMKRAARNQERQRTAASSTFTQASDSAPPATTANRPAVSTQGAVSSPGLSQQETELNTRRTVSRSSSHHSCGGGDVSNAEVEGAIEKTHRKTMRSQTMTRSQTTMHGQKRPIQNMNETENEISDLRRSVKGRKKTNYRKNTQPSQTQPSQSYTDKELFRLLNKRSKRKTSRVRDDESQSEVDTQVLLQECLGVPESQAWPQESQMLPESQPFVWEESEDLVDYHGKGDGDSDSEGDGDSDGKGYNDGDGNGDGGGDGDGYDDGDSDGADD